MEHSLVSALPGWLDGVDVVSTDVFDTLLLRTYRSERSRLIRGEQLFAASLARHGIQIDAVMLTEARLQAQRLAFRALGVGRRCGEVRLSDIVDRQLACLGLPARLGPERVRIELEVEKCSLVKNAVLADLLGECRRSGRRIIAISDTTLSATGVSELIEYHYGSDIIDAVYTSADLGCTKRHGALFAAVARIERVPLERIRHVGDDAHADVEVAVGLGMKVHHVPRPASGRYARRAHGGLAEAARVWRKRIHVSHRDLPTCGDTRAFGRQVFGPLVVQFCLRIWLYAAQAEATHEPVMLFCARGGLSIREAFERVLKRLALPLRSRRENLLVSRLVAVRAALLVGATSAMEEIDREFRGQMLGKVAQALSGSPHQLSTEWQHPFIPEVFRTLLTGSSGQAVLADITHQNDLFTHHLLSLTGSADRLILCDTGLFGSTQRLLADAFAALPLETIQFARSNYKKFSERHFTSVSGLMVERNSYNPVEKQTCVLRFWHLIESLFEPAIPSVRLFTEDTRGNISANAGEVRFGSLDPSVGNMLLTGAFDYIDNLPRDGGRAAFADAEIAWHRLDKAITRPTEADVAHLEVGGRSVDFGRSDVLPVIRQNAVAPPGRSARLMSLHTQLWREGAIARNFPVLKHVLWPLLDSAHSVKSVLGPLSR